MFLILILFLFILAIRIGGTILAYIFTPSKNPVLIGGMVDGTQSKQFSANPNDNNSVLIMRSANKRSGMEYTWSTWIYVEDGAISDGYKHIFHKGNHNIVSEDSSSIGRAYVGTNAPNNGPGLYIQPNINNLEVIVSTFNNPKNSIVVEDIPLNKWINVILRLENNTFDVYINGQYIDEVLFQKILSNE